jgi:hypothetical protein
MQLTLREDYTVPCHLARISGEQMGSTATTVVGAEP